MHRVLPWRTVVDLLGDLAMQEPAFCRVASFPPVGRAVGSENLVDQDTTQLRG